MVTTRIDTPSLSARWLFWWALALITLAEWLAATQPHLGLTLHGLLLAALLIWSGAASTENERNLALALTLAPLIRIVSFSLPLPLLPQMAWYPSVSLVLLSAFWLITRQTGATRRGLGLCGGQIVLQLTLALGGVGLGTIEYLILLPTPQQGSGSWLNIMLMVLSLMIFTGLIEELIFRGLLQSLAPLVLGRWGFAYVALLFGVLHIGYLSLADVVFATLVGLLFAQIVRWSGSILGVTLAHGLTNIMLFWGMPTLAVQAPELLGAVSSACITVGGLALAFALGIMGLQAWTEVQPEKPAALVGLRRLRREAGLTYTELAARTRLSVRRLAEIELGLKQPQPDELRRIAAALGTAPERLALAA